MPKNVKVAGHSVSPYGDLSRNGRLVYCLINIPRFTAPKVGQYGVAVLDEVMAVTCRLRLVLNHFGDSEPITIRFVEY